MPSSDAPTLALGSLGSAGGDDDQVNRDEMEAHGPNACRQLVFASPYPKHKATQAEGGAEAKPLMKKPACKRVRDQRPRKPTTLSEKAARARREKVIMASKVFQLLPDEEQREKYLKVRMLQYDHKLKRTASVDGNAASSSRGDARVSIKRLAEVLQPPTRRSKRIAAKSAQALPGDDGVKEEPDTADDVEENSDTSEKSDASDNVEDEIVTDSSGDEQREGESMQEYLTRLQTKYATIQGTVDRLEMEVESAKFEEPYDPEREELEEIDEEVAAMPIDSSERSTLDLLKKSGGGRGKGISVGR